MATARATKCHFRTAQGAGISVDMEARLIKGVSVITRGEAKGHGMWADAEFLQQIADAGNASAKGIESRFKHPMFEDKLGTHLGRFVEFRVEGDKVRADLKVSALADKSPTHPNLGTYVLGLADEEPDVFGASIAFDMDIEAVEKFVYSNQGENSNFSSPDPKNTQNLPHARLGKLEAVDIVGDPAANPDGLLQEKSMPDEQGDTQEALESNDTQGEQLQEDGAPMSVEEKVSKLQAEIAALQEAMNELLSKMQDEETEMEAHTDEDEEEKAMSEPVSPSLSIGEKDARDFLNVQVALGKVHPSQVETFTVALCSSTPAGATALIEGIKANKPADTFQEDASVSEDVQEGKPATGKAKLEGEALYASEWSKMGKSAQLAFKNKEAYFKVRENEDNGFFQEG